MTFGEAVSSGFRNYVRFSGRASRSEFWYWVLFTVLASIAAGIIDFMIFGADARSPDPVSSLLGLVLFLPSLGMHIRRLHDIDRTGWWLLLALTGIGWILLLIWACMRGTEGPNRFGSDGRGSFLPAGFNQGRF